MDKIMVTIMVRKSYHQINLKSIALLILLPIVIPPSSYGTTQSIKQQFDLFDRLC